MLHDLFLAFLWVTGVFIFMFAIFVLGTLFKTGHEILGIILVYTYLVVGAFAIIRFVGKEL